MTGSNTQKKLPGFALALHFSSLAICPTASSAGAPGTYPDSIMSKSSRYDCFSPWYRSVISCADTREPVHCL